MDFKNAQGSFIKSFNLYDHIAYILVGSVGIALVILDLSLSGKSGVVPSFDPKSYLAWFIAAYFLGHTIQAISNLLIKEDRTNFSDAQKEVLNQAREYFKLKDENHSNTFLMCYMLACIKDFTGQIRTFNAYYGLYRGWFTVFLLESVALVILNYCNWFDFRMLVLLISTSILSFLFFKRAKRFYLYLRAKVLQSFILTKELKL